MLSASALLRLLGDDTRLRLLRLLARENLNVSELTAVLGVAQSGVSRHLGLLRDAGLVAEKRAGTFTWYSLAPEIGAAKGAQAGLWGWLREEFDRATAETKADDARLEEIRRLRKESFSQHGAGDERRQLVPGRSWAAWARALGLLLPPLDVADLGCGEGYVTIEASRWAKRVIAIDQSADVLARARAMAERRRVSNVTWKRGRLERLPLRDETVDVALLSQALHHADKPEVALAEAYRILRPGGRLILLDLREHEEGWVSRKLGDKWLGFSDRALRKLLTEAGFADVELRVGARKAGDPFVVLIGRGVRPDAGSKDKARKTRGKGKSRAGTAAKATGKSKGRGNKG
jgi:ArsR family transcriptional regulator